MEPRTNGDRPCYGRLAEKDLLRLVQEENDPKAAQELVLRALPWMMARIAAHAQHDHLQVADRQDAEQEGALTFLTVLPYFDSSAAEKPGRSNLRIFGGVAASRRYHNFVRDLFRATRAVASSPVVAEWLSGNAHAEGDLGSPSFLCATVPDDPADLAQRQESVQRLEAAICRLEATDRWLVEQVLAGNHLSQIARVENRSYKAVKYQWEKIREQLRERLKETGEETPGRPT
jgi:DNA-directed RNA polymerase specialized sigma24 family protein